MSSSDTGTSEKASPVTEPSQPEGKEPEKKPADDGDGIRRGVDPILDKVIDGCRIVRKLGQGGMGVVYLARSEADQSESVVKILNPALVGAEDTVERFFREAQSCAQLSHPGIVAVQNVGQDGEYYFIRMEFVRGQTLEDMVKAKSRLDWRQATQITIDAAEALWHAHQKGMIHRDIKPENIMYTGEGQVKVMDFGLAKQVNSAGAKVSVTGQIVGTPFFMSPEQAGGKPTDARSDLYSLGVTLYYLVTGVKPFNGKNLQEIFLKHFFYAPESPKIYNGALPDSLCDVVKKCLKKKKKERHQTAKELADELRHVLKDPDAAVPSAGAGAAGEEDGEAAPGPGPAPLPTTAVDGSNTVRAGPGPAPAAEVDDKTVRTQAAAAPAGAAVEDDKTVRVGAAARPAVAGLDDEPDDKTVKVAKGKGPKPPADDDDDGPEDKTVRVTRDPGRSDGVASVSFRGGSMVFGDKPAGDDGATVKVGPGESAPDGPSLKPPEAGPEPLTPAQRAAQQKRRAMIAGGVLLVPLLLYGGFELSARSKLESLKVPFDAAIEASDATALRDLAADFDMFAESYPFSSRVGEARNLAVRCRDRAEFVERQAAEERQRLLDEEEERRRLVQQRERYEQAQQAAQTAFASLEALREARRYRECFDAGLAFVRDHAAFPDLVSQVRVPINVSSDPFPADVHFREGGDIAEGSSAAAQTPGVLWVRPNVDVHVRVARRGFNPAEFRVRADEWRPLDAPLTRRVLRDLPCGTARVRIGAQPVDEEVLPTHELRFDRSGDGVAYFVGHDGLLRAINLRRGGERWVPGEVHRVAEYGDPTVAPELVPGRALFVASLRGTVMAHHPSTGERMWPAPADCGSGITGAPRYIRGDGTSVLAVGTAAGAVFFLNDQAGDVHWTFQTENAVVSPVLFQGNDRAFVGSTDNVLYALDWRARRELGRLDLGADIVAGPVALGRRLAVGTAAGLVHVIDATSPGALRRVAVLGSADARAPVRSLEVAPNADGSQSVYFGVDRKLRAVSMPAGSDTAPPTPTPLWEKTLPSPITRPVVVDDVLYVCAESGFLYAIDRATGDTLWSYSTEGAPIRQAPIVRDNELYLLIGSHVRVLELD